MGGGGSDSRLNTGGGSVTGGSACPLVEGLFNIGRFGMHVPGIVLMGKHGVTKGTGRFSGTRGEKGSEGGLTAQNQLLKLFRSSEENGATAINSPIQAHISFVKSVHPYIHDFLGRIL